MPFFLFVLRALWALGRVLVFSVILIGSNLSPFVDEASHSPDPKPSKRLIWPLLATDAIHFFQKCAFQSASLCQKRFIRGISLFNEFMIHVCLHSTVVYLCVVYVRQEGGDQKNVINQLKYAHKKIDKFDTEDKKRKLNAWRSTSENWGEKRSRIGRKWLKPYNLITKTNTKTWKLKWRDCSRYFNRKSQIILSELLKTHAEPEKRNGLCL